MNFTITTTTMATSVSIDAGYIVLYSCRYMICMFGSALNLDLIFLTYKYKPLQSPCKILVAIETLSNGIFQLSYTIVFVIVASGIGTIPLSTCFFIQVIPKLFVEINLPLILAISIDRLLSVLVPIWYQQKNPRRYIFIVLLICFGFGLYSSALSFIRTQHELPKKQVICYTSDLPPADLRQYAMIFNFGSIFAYACMWAVIKIRQRNSTMQMERFTKSLLAITFAEFLSWGLTNISLTYSAGLKQLIGEKSAAILVTIQGFISLGTLAINAPILYIINMDYREAFRDHLKRIRAKMRSQYATTAVISLQH